ncbi:MAG: hypothetical protein M1818_000530 [Claussenomyces sp. TS43310]|nr:MAG: hypothetical protein M1818_000530 [Claussenomyces sp. TS43310]
MLTVHHLQISQSERIPWLCEELNIPYELKLYKRDPLLAPPSFKALTSIGSAPVINDGPLTLGESAAVIEYIIHKHGNGRLALPPSHKDYADYLYWFHFANGTLQPAAVSVMNLWGANVGEDQPVVKGVRGKLGKILDSLNERLGAATWLAGEEFTAADIMSVFTLTTMRSFISLDLSSYPNILAYLQRIGQREAYKRAMAKGDPDLEPLLGGPAPQLMPVILALKK